MSARARLSLSDAAVSDARPSAAHPTHRASANTSHTAPATETPHVKAEPRTAEVSSDDDGQPVALASTTSPSVGVNDDALERMIVALDERVSEQKVQVVRAFESSQRQLRECANIVRQYQHVLSSQAPPVSATNAVGGSLSLRDEATHTSTGETVAESCASSVEKALRSSEVLFRYLFEPLYLHQLLAHTELAEAVKRILSVPLDGSRGDVDGQAVRSDTGGPQAVSAAASILRTDAVMRALESLKQVPHVVQRSQASLHYAQLTSPSTDLPATFFARSTEVFAVSGHYSPQAQQEIVSFLSGAFHVMVLVLPPDVPEDALAVYMRCRLLVTPKTFAAKPILSVPRERLEQLYKSAHAGSQAAGEGHFPPSPSAAPTASDRATAQTSASAAVGENTGVTARRVESVTEDEIDKEHAAMADADAELLELLRQLDSQQHRHPVAEWSHGAGRSRSPFTPVPSPNSERSLAFPPATSTPRPEDASTLEASTSGPTGTLTREGSLSNTTAVSLSQVPTSQSACGRTLESQQRSRRTPSTLFTRHRQEYTAGVADDGLGRMSTATQPAIFFSHPRKRARHDGATTPAPPTEAPSHSPMTGAGVDEPLSVPVNKQGTVAFHPATTRDRPKENSAAQTPHNSAVAEEAVEDEPVVVAASQPTVAESQVVRYNHALRRMDYKPLPESFDPWTSTGADAEDCANAAAPDADGEHSNQSATGTGGDVVSRSDSSSRSRPRSHTAQPMVTVMPSDDEASIGFASVHSPLECAAPLMLPGTAAAMQAPSTSWLFQISNSVRDQRPALVEWIQQLGGEVDLRSAFNPRATHLITMEGLTERTEKYLSACAAGILIVPPRCVADCARRGHWLRGQKMLEYNMNPCRRFLSQPSEYHALPFAQWHVLLLTSHAAVARGIHTVLRAGGCRHATILIFDEKGESPSAHTPTVAAAVAEFAPVSLAYRAAAHQGDHAGAEGTQTPTIMEGLHPLSPVDPELVCHSTHVLVECADMSLRAPGMFQLPRWFPVCLMRRELYPRLFTLEILYHSLCSSLEPVFQPRTGQLLSENALIPACRVEPFQ